MKKLLISFLLINIHFLFAQTHTELRKISGKITYQEEPLQGVSIIIENTTKGTKSNAQGFYAIQAKPGDVIVYSHLGYKTLRLLVEDVTTLLNIEMVLKSEQLEEVVVKATIPEYEDPKAVIKDSWGSTKKITQATSTVYIKGEDLNQGYTNIVEALANKGVSGVIFKVDPNPKKTFAKSTRTISINYSQNFLWDVDGVLYENTPDFLQISMIEDIRVIKSLSDLTRYGSAGAGGVIVVRTKTAANMDEVEKKETAQKYYNKIFYNNDALDLTRLKPYDPQLTNQITQLQDKQKALALIKSQIESGTINFHQAIEAALLLKTHYQDITAMATILSLLKTKYHTHPELLKTLGYYYQSLGRKKDAVEVFENVFRLRPNYLQSYRDLANAYKNTGQFKRAWRMYVNYLSLGKNIGDKEIGKLINSEMEWLYFMQKEKAGIKGTFIPASGTKKNFQNDVRLVVEWNTSDADFVIEFVGAENRAFHFNHTLQDNQEVIFDEKLNGYSCREYIIDRLGDTNWLINITYLGNKKPEPTYFKFTLYRNWGKPNQQEEVIVQKFYTEREKYNLFTLSKNRITPNTSG